MTPEINWAAALFMLPVAIAPCIEHIGGVLAIGGVTGKDYTKNPGLHRTLAGDGIGVCFAGFIGGPPVTTYAEVTGAVMITRNFNPVTMTGPRCSPSFWPSLASSTPCSPPSRCR